MRIFITLSSNEFHYLSLPELLQTLDPFSHKTFGNNQRFLTDSSESEIHQQHSSQITKHDYRNFNRIIIKFYIDNDEI